MLDILFLYAITKRGTKEELQFIPTGVVSQLANSIRERSQKNGRSFRSGFDALFFRYLVPNKT